MLDLFSHNNTTADRAVLVDLDSFSHVRTLHGAEGVGLQHAMFLTNGETIVTCFRDDTVIAWSTTSLSVRSHDHQPHPQPLLSRPSSRCRCRLKPIRCPTSGRLHRRATARCL